MCLCNPANVSVVKCGPACAVYAADPVQDAACEHRSVNLQFDLKLFPENRRVLFLRLRCACGAPFLFHGLPVGQDPSRPTMDLTGTMAALPIRPEGQAQAPSPGAVLGMMGE